MKSFEMEVDEMIDAVVKLTWNHLIFRALLENKRAYSEARAAHPEFVLTICESLFCTFCVVIDLLFEDKKAKATSLCALIKDIETRKPILAKHLTDKIAAKRSLIEKFGILRNQALAHRWETKTTQQVFAESGITPNIMQEIVDLARLIICEMAGEAGGNRKQTLDKQQLSETTLQAVFDDASQVIRSLSQLEQTK